MSSLTIAASTPRQSAAEPERAAKNSARQDEFSRMVADASEKKSKNAEPGAFGAKGSAKERSAEASDEKSIEGKQAPRSDSGNRVDRELAPADERVVNDRAAELDIDNIGNNDESNDAERPRAASEAVEEGPTAGRTTVKPPMVTDQPMAASAEPGEDGQDHQAKDTPSGNPEIEVVLPITAQAPAAAVLAVAPYLNAKSAADKQSGSTAPQRVPSDGNAASTARPVEAEGGRDSSVAMGRDKAVQSGSIRTGDGAIQINARPMVVEGALEDVAPQARTVPVPENRSTGQATPSIAPPPKATTPNNALPPMPATDAAKASIPTITIDPGRLPGREAEGLGATRELIASHVTRVATMTNPGQPVPVLRLQLQPVHLGQINVTMRMADGAVSVQLTPDSETAARVLATDRDSIVAAVRALGGSFANASIEVGGDGQMRQGADDGGQQRNAGSDLREGAQGGDAGFGRSGNDAQGGRDDASRAVERDGETSSGGGRIII